MVANARANNGGERQRLEFLVRCLSRLGAVLAAVALSFSSASVKAQTDDGDFVHWAYSAFFGTGWYELGEQGTAFAFSYGPRWQLRDASLGSDGKRSVGIELRFPLSGSLHELDFSDIAGNAQIENLSTLSAVPGIEVEVPVTKRWSLKAAAYLGWGTELGGGASAWIYWAGLRSRYKLPSARIDWALINSIFYVGYTPESGPSGAISPFMTGLEIEQRFGDATLGGDPLYLRWHGAYTRYHDFEFAAQEVETFGRTRTDVKDEWELGVALRKADGPLAFWFLEWDQVGLAYRFNTQHNIKALSITFRALFDR